MAKYKININKPLPSSKKIADYKNFDNVLSSYSKMHRPLYLLRNIYRDQKLLRWIIFFMIILLTIYFTHKKIDSKNKKSHNTIEVTPSNPQEP